MAEIAILAKNGRKSRNPIFHEPTPGRIMSNDISFEVENLPLIQDFHVTFF